MRLGGAAGAIAIACALAACPRHAPPVEPPSLGLERWAAGPELRLTIRVRARDRRPLALDALDWSLAIDDGPPRRGRVHLSGTLAAGATRAISFAVAPLPGAGGRRFALGATLHARGPDGPIAAFLDQTGALRRATREP